MLDRHPRNASQHHPLEPRSEHIAQRTQEKVGRSALELAAAPRVERDFDLFDACAEVERLDAYLGVDEPAVRLETDAVHQAALEHFHVLKLGQGNPEQEPNEPVSCQWSSTCGSMGWRRDWSGPPARDRTDQGSAAGGQDPPCRGTCRRYSTEARVSSPCQSSCGSSSHSRGFCRAWRRAALESAPATGAAAAASHRCCHRRRR